MTVSQPSVFEASSAGKLVWPGGTARCALGRGGVLPARQKREGDGATPLGAWRMCQAFYRPDRMAPPKTGLKLTALTPQMGWCDDPASPLYNQLVGLPFPASHEIMWRADGLYDLVVELGYNNDPVIAGRGSAIFLHVAQPDFSPTEGCVATGREALLALLAAAGPGDALAITDASSLSAG